MERVFKIGDIVILKDIGMRCMKVINVSEDFDEEAKSHFMGHILKAFDRDTNESVHESSNDNFNEEEHKIYYATCEWCDDNGVRYEDTFEESKLSYCEGEPPRTVIKGFTRE